MDPVGMIIIKYTMCVKSPMLKLKNILKAQTAQFGNDYAIIRSNGKNFLNTLCV